MSANQKNGLNLVGVIFLLLGVFKFINGDSWVVWIILGIIFGGLGAFGRKGSSS